MLTNIWLDSVTFPELCGARETWSYCLCQGLNQEKRKREWDYM